MCALLDPVYHSANIRFHTLAGVIVDELYENAYKTSESYNTAIQHRILLLRVVVSVAVLAEISLRSP